jgi:hypothetical protein
MAPPVGALSRRIAEALRAQSRTSGEVAEAIGVPAKMASSVLNRLRRAGRVRVVGRRHSPGARLSNVWALAEVAPRAQPVPRAPVYLDAAPASLTAALLGDPLPGRSALDQRKAGR